MTKVAIVAILFLFSLFTLAMPNTLPRVSAPPRPLCASQFNIVNYACGGLPLSPFSPPPSRRNTHSSSSSSHSRRSSSRRHRRRHRQRGEDRQDYCCQWLRQVDNECVCDVLAHLPPFLSRPNHHYTVTVGNTCIIRFPCGGRLVP
ncbi:hypothetical protein F3Y22_tig00001849pilonHSYRG00008 [Hibiscus syriacus]|uniref:Bifunctional inhibitor/plant lipid transfer protein/seed storage helical domain-containing protein n=1 Tax=Hibiscus syriacus TaxID=106335 RepID=A0A6A3CSI2_HIBSY|nr:hypothetical protein F3Y22_tig00001849pilonHSYRG00008 [Hibiscus syriacus]